MVIGEGRRKLAIHGPVVDLFSSVPFLDPTLDLLFSKFAVNSWPQALVPTTGSIHPYNETEVLSRLPESAQKVGHAEDAMDIYEDGQRCWIVDDRWGMAEIDLPNREFRSWILPQPSLDVHRVAELSVLWPMSHFLRRDGVNLLPAMSAVRDGFAFLLICPFGIEPELTALINSGYKIIGQRWTALREEDGRMALLHIPGRIERLTTPRLRYGGDEQESWIDITREYPGSSQNHAFCDAILVAEPGRRALANLTETSQGEIASLLHDALPMPELHPGQSSSALPELMAQSCRCFEVQLSRSSKDLLGLLNSMRYGDTLGDEQSVAA